MTDVQIIEDKGNPKYAILPYKKYLKLQAKAEGFSSVEDYLDYKRATEIIKLNTETFSHNEIKKIVASKNK